MRLYCEHCKVWRDQMSFENILSDTVRTLPRCRVCLGTKNKKRGPEKGSKYLHTEKRVCLRCDTDQEFDKSTKDRICRRCKKRKTLD